MGALSPGVESQLHLLHQCMGSGQISEFLGCEQVYIDEVVAGRVPLSPEFAVGIDELYGMVEGTVGEDRMRDIVDGDGPEFDLAGDGEVAPAPAGEYLPEVIGLDLDLDGRPDVSFREMLAGRPGVGFSSEMKMKKDALWNSRTLAYTTMFRLNATHQELVVAVGMIAQIELALITMFGESVPEPGQNWDGNRRLREMERRLSRIHWVRQEQAKEYSGLKGLYNWFMGRPKLTGRDLYERVISEADAMLGAMQDGRNEDLITDALRFTGVGDI